MAKDAYGPLLEGACLDSLNLQDHDIQVGKNCITFLLRVGVTCLATKSGRQEDGPLNNACNAQKFQCSCLLSHKAAPDAHAGTAANTTGLPSWTSFS